MLITPDCVIIAWVSYHILHTIANRVGLFSCVVFECTPIRLFTLCYCGGNHLCIFLGTNYCYSVPLTIAIKSENHKKLFFHNALFIKKGAYS